MYDSANTGSERFPLRTARFLSTAPISNMGKRNTKKGKDQSIVVVVVVLPLFSPCPLGA